MPKAEYREYTRHNRTAHFLKFFDCFAFECTISNSFRSMDTTKFNWQFFSFCSCVNVLCAEPTNDKLLRPNQINGKWYNITTTLKFDAKQFCIVFFLFSHYFCCCSPTIPYENTEMLSWNQSDKLTVIIVNIIVAIHFQLNGAIGTRPAFDAHAFVFTILERTLTMTRTSIFATSFRELTG